MAEGLEIPKGPASLTHDEWQEHLELSHYISVFNTSAGRVRYVMFIIMVLSITIIVAQWNTTDDSWAQPRYKKLLAAYEKAKPMQESAANASVRETTHDRYTTRAELTETLAEYRKRLIDRVFFTDIPALGTTFDVNDLGLFSGIAYTLLLLLLLFSLMREHENLCLALFKVERLHDRESKRPDGKRPDGESTANFLYHALAMGTVFTTPPSLARWRPAAPQRWFLNVVFFVPSLVQSYIVITNYNTLPIARAYGATTSIMLPQYSFLAVVVALGGLALVYSQAANRRWEGAFFHLNPALRRVQQQPWSMWVKRSRRAIHQRLQRKLWAQAIQKLECDEVVVSEPPVTVSKTLTIGDLITYDEVIQMCLALETRAAEDAGAGHEEFVASEIVSSTLNGSSWVVTARWWRRSKPDSGTSAGNGVG